MSLTSSPPTAAAHTLRRSSGAVFLRHNRGVLIIAAVFIALFGVSIASSGGAFDYFEASFMSSGGATLALAAMGQALVVLVGGFDLSVGSVVSLVNVVLATHMGASLGSMVGVGVLGLAVGGAVGAFNGFFVAFLGSSADRRDLVLDVSDPGCHGTGA